MLVALRTHNGRHHVCAIGGGGGKVTADQIQVGESEKLALIQYVTDDGRTGSSKVRVHLRCPNGMYLCAENGGGGLVSANRIAAGPWEEFAMEVKEYDQHRQPLKVAFRTHNGHYLCAEGGGGGQLVADRTEAKVWETFEIVRQPYTWKDLEISFTSTFTRVWADNGSGAIADVAFWRPVPPPGFVSIGDLCVPNHDDPNGRRMVAVVRDLSGRALREPDGYDLVWEDRGSGAEADVSVWQPRVGTGWAALGMVTTPGYGVRPPKDAIRCVRSDLVARGVVGDSIWTDAGSRANWDFSAWKIAMPNETREGRIYVSPNTFLGVRSHTKPDEHASAYCLNIGSIDLPAMANPSMADLGPIQNGASTKAPQFGGDTVHHTIFMPWFAVKDSELSDLERMLTTPVYRLERTDRYALLMDPINNLGGTTTQRNSIAIATGYSEAKLLQFANATGAKISWKWSVDAAPLGIGAGAEVTAEISNTFTWTHGTTKTTSQTITKTVELNVPPGKFGAVYGITSSIRMFRADGTQVTESVDGFGDHSQIQYFETGPGLPKA